MRPRTRLRPPPGLVAAAAEVVLRTRRYRGQSPAGRAVSRRLLAAFRTGFGLGLRGAGREPLLRVAGELPWTLHGFLHEGNACGRTGRAALLRRGPEAPAAAEEQPFMRALGRGLWNGIAYRFRLPPIDHPLRWQEVEGPPRFRLVAADGDGFAAVLFAGGLSAGAGEGLLAHRPAERPSAAHGAGRALWILHLGEPAAVRRMLLAAARPGGALGGEGPALADDLAAGVGFALAYTQVDRPDRIAAGIAELGDGDRARALRRSLACGAGVALETHAAGGPGQRAEIESLVSGELAECYRAARRASRTAEPGAGWYADYRRLTAAALTPAPAPAPVAGG